MILIDPERAEFANCVVQLLFDPYRVGLILLVCDPVAVPPAIESHALSVQRMTVRRQRTIDSSPGFQAWVRATPKSHRRL